MNTALELGGCSARQDGAPGRWTRLGRTGPNKNVVRSSGLGNEPPEGRRRAFWRRDGIVGQRIEDGNKAPAKILDSCKRVRLSTAVLQCQNGSFIESSSGWIEMPRASFLSRSYLPDEMIKCNVSVSD